MPSRRHRAAVQALALAVRRLLLDTPGHTATRITIGKDQNGIVTITAIATGWSTSLSRRPLTTEHCIGIQDREGDEAPARAAAALAHRLATARRRHALATAHGLRAEHGSALDPALLLIDRATATMLAELGVDPAAAVLWHRRRTTETGVEDVVRSNGRYHSTGVTTIALGPDDTLPTLSVEMLIARPGSPVAILRDNDLSIATTIPETLLAAAVGRPLGALVETRIPTLDARIVTQAVAAIPGLGPILTLAPDRITVGEAQAITPLPLAVGTGPTDTGRQRRTNP